MQFVEVYNKHDATAVAALFTQDAVRVVDWEAGTNFFGREAIEKGFAADFASSPPNLVRKLVQMCACEDRIVTISEWSGGSWHGHSVGVYVRDADTWKIRMEFVTVTQMPR
jgi:ketosteroid isomerase-like protein